MRREIDAFSCLVGIVAGGGRNPINDRPREAGEFLHIKCAFVDPGNLDTAFEIEKFVIIALAGVELDDDFIVFELSVWLKVSILLNHLSGDGHSYEHDKYGLQMISLVDSITCPFHRAPDAASRIRLNH